MPTKDVTAKLPEAIAAYVKASNTADMVAYIATFEDDPLVNDIRREFWGKPAIKAWAEREIFGDNVAMEVLRAVEHYGDVILSAKFDGTYDKTGLPDPLILTLYFTLRESHRQADHPPQQAGVRERDRFGVKPSRSAPPSRRRAYPACSNRAPAHKPEPAPCSINRNLSSPAGLQLHRSKLRVADPGDAREEVVLPLADRIDPVERLLRR